MLPITDHQPRHVRGLRYEYASSDPAQSEHGACMDSMADQWLPLGGMRGEEYMRGTDCHYAFRTGLVYVRRIEPARREAFPVVDGVRYHVVMHRTAHGLDMEAWAMRKGSRKLKPWSARWRTVTDEAIRYHAYL
jgi:hypothetical protein